MLLTVFMQPSQKKVIGIIAGGAMRALFDAIGIRTSICKVQGSTNPYNVVRATIKGLQLLIHHLKLRAKRGKTVAEITGEE